eukprot:CAMPEP_0201548924 /NCGR_PEP_ID=MMETSP0173_2-20130828/5429_1 /ASSEMBLY_ACC=CAM_ASM_000268 /TAXON_ID=218659 /ORGANISM="Vexillifera sp., Strain DIVA3 564/2" /LENGTH=144 /DNA_ID=CAMNT_0047958445 /DNA_START=52 /DNA_END=486 /DNA_ORIENTATION=-
MNAPSSLIWELVKKHHAKKVRCRQDGNVFSIEKNNVLNFHSRKYCGFVGKSVGVELNEQGGTTLRMPATNKDKQQKPAKSVYEINFKSSHNPQHLKKAVTNNVKSVRPDLAEQAAVRAARLRDSLHAKTGGVAKKRRRGRRARA